MSDDRRFRPRHQPGPELPDLPTPGVESARLALLVAASDLLEARHLAPDDEVREEIDSILAQVHRVSDDLADRLDGSATEEADG